MVYFSAKITNVYYITNNTLFKDKHFVKDVLFSTTRTLLH